MTKKTGNCGPCPVAGDCGDAVTNTLCRIGVTRGTLVTLALLPFAWDGVLWAADVVRFCWDAVTSAVS